MISDLAASAPIDTDKVAKIKAAISSGNYPLDLDKILDSKFNTIIINYQIIN